MAEGVIKAEEDIPQIEDEDEQAKSDAYSEEMKAKMGGSLEYRHELGINFHQILPDLYVGSCMQTAADVQRYECLRVPSPCLHLAATARDMKHLSSQQIQYSQGAWHWHHPLLAKRQRHGLL